MKKELLKKFARDELRLRARRLCKGQSECVGCANNAEIGDGMQAMRCLEEVAVEMLAEKDKKICDMAGSLIAGEIINGNKDATVYVGEGSCKIEGEQKNYTLEYGYFSHNPMVTYKNRRYVLSWQEIISAAIKTGLFND